MLFFSYLNKKLYLIPILICLLVISAPAYCLNENWQEVHSTKDGKQWWDTTSIVKEGGDIINIKTIFLPTNQSKSTDSSYIFFDMDIDCDQRVYKDQSINQKQIPKATWRSPGSDLLITSIINQACEFNNKI